VSEIPQAAREGARGAAKARPERAGVYIAGALRDVVWRERRDDGGMFGDAAEVGVWHDSGGFVAYAKDGWGGGVRSKHHPDEATARRDTERLWERLYG
jgi:hypothetical protein